MEAEREHRHPLKGFCEVRDALRCLTACCFWLHIGGVDEADGCKGCMLSHSASGSRSVPPLARAYSAGCDVQPSNLQQHGRPGSATLVRVRGGREGQLPAHCSRAAAEHGKQLAKARASDAQPAAARL
eukprot:6184653-Pleurochrysis_carterae.AAC.2